MQFLIIKKVHIRKFLIFISTFMITFAHTEGFSNLKYLGLLLLLSLIIFHIFKKGVIKSKLFIFFFVLVLFSLSFLFQTLTLKQVLMAFLFYLTLCMLVFFGLYILKKPSDYFWWGMGMFVAIIVGFIFDPIKIISQMQSLSRVRIHGNYMHPNAFASVLFSTYTIFHVHKIIENNKKIPYSCISALLIILIILSNSRGYILLTIIFIIVCNLYKIKIFPRWVKPIVYVLICISSSYIIWYFWNYYVSLDGSYMSRINGILSMNIDEKYMLFGYGMVSSGEIDYSIIEDGSMEIAWAKLFYKNGIIGIGIFIFLLMYCFKKGIYKCKSKQQLCYIAIFLTFIIGSFVESNLVTIFNMNPIYTWTILSSLPYIRLDNKSEEI